MKITHQLSKNKLLLTIIALATFSHQNSLCELRKNSTITIKNEGSAGVTVFLHSLSGPADLFVPDNYKTIEFDIPQGKSVTKHLSVGVMYDTASFYGKDKSGKPQEWGTADVKKNWGNNERIMINPFSESNYDLTIANGDQGKWGISIND